MARQRRVFTPEFKLRVVREVLSGQSQASVARKYELSPHLIPLWKKAFQAGRLGGEAIGGPSVQQLLQEKQVLGEIVQEQAQQIHLLKKAVSALTPPSASNSSAMSGKNSRSQQPAS